MDRLKGQDDVMCGVLSLYRCLQVSLFSPMRYFVFEVTTQGWTLMKRLVNFAHHLKRLTTIGNLRNIIRSFSKTNKPNLFQNKAKIAECTVKIRHGVLFTISVKL